MHPNKELNHHDKIFGPVGSTAGIFIANAGIVITFYSFAGIILIALGAFVGFSSTATIVDFEKKRMKFSIYLFGIISLGKWMDINDEMRLAIRESRKTWRSFSRGNRPLDIQTNDYRIILLTKEGKEIIPVKKCKDVESAKTNLDRMIKLRLCYSILSRKG